MTVASTVLMKFRFQGYRCKSRIEGYIKCLNFDNKSHLAGARTRLLNQFYFGIRLLKKLSVLIFLMKTEPWYLLMLILWGTRGGDIENE